MDDWDKDISKYGFYVVIVMHEDGSKGLVYKHDERENCPCAQFKSEKLACEYKEFAKGVHPECTYYYRYVSWSMYD